MCLCVWFEGWTCICLHACLFVESCVYVCGCVFCRLMVRMVARVFDMCLCGCVCVCVYVHMRMRVVVVAVLFACVVVWLFVCIHTCL